ncbi:MAG: hypothetical protein RIS64_3589 [Bacteroidota bacterium]|jgi:hypothetical protein
MKIIDFKYITLIATVLFSSCSANYFTPIVDVAIPLREAKLVVIADFWSGEQELNVFVTTTRASLDNTPYDYTGVDTILTNPNRPGGGRTQVVPILIDTVSGVVVKLTKNGQAFAQLNSTGLGRYRTTLAQPLAEDGATYTLTISAPGYPTIESTQKMPASTKLDSVTYNPDASVTDPNNPFSKNIRDEYVLDFKDVANQENYYTAVAQATTKDAAGTETIQNIPFSSLDPLSESNVVTDRNLDGKRIVWREHTNRRLKSSGRGGGGGGGGNVAVSGSIQVVLLSITKERFNYIKSYALYQSTLNNPLAEPVILYSNINNGYGLFSIGANRGFTVLF